jgi:O-antigen ligase
LLTPAFVLFVGWLCITVLLSFDPGTSIRRFTITACVIAVTAALPLLAKSQAEIMRWLSIAALVLLATCYLGILLAPHLSIHQATDPQEPGLAGNWRGSFGHKNGAAAVMAILMFLGIYFIRAGGWILGIAVISLSLLFLLYAGGKSALTLCFMVLLLTSLCQVIRSFWLRAVLLLTPLVLLNMLGVGTVMSDSLAEIAKLLPLDASFTGRTDIWTFAIQSLQPRLATGYGFAAFWGSTAIQDLPEGKEWAAFASHSHNGYLDTALGMGLPGLALLIGAIVIKPLRDFQAADQGGNGGPLATLFLRIWLFGLYLSSMESFFLDRAEPMWFTVLVAVFGLHYMARFRAKA